MAEFVQTREDTTLSLGPKFAVDTEDATGIEWPISKLAYGALQTFTLVSATSGLPVEQQTGSTWQVDVDGSAVVRAADAASGATDTGVMSLVVRNDVLASLVSADGDYAPLQVNASGALYVEVVTSALPSGAATAANQSTGNAALAAIQTAVELIDDPVATISATPLMRVAIFDAADAQITSFGGGVQYTEGATDASITGTAIMMEGAADTLVAAQGTVADGLLVNLGTNNDVTVTGTVTANAGTNLNTSLLALESGGNLATLAGAVAGTEMQVDIVAVTPDLMLGTDFSSVFGASSLVTTTQADNIANTTDGINSTCFLYGFDGTAWDRLPGTSVDGLLVNLGTNNDVTVTGSVTANAGTNLNTSLLALETGGNLATVAGAVSGTEMQVDVVAALPAGTNNIGDVDVLSVVPGTGTTNLGKAVDDAAGGTDTGVAILAIRDDALTTLTPIDGDYVNLRVNSTGALHVTGGGGGTEYVEDDVAPANPTAAALSLVRADTPALNGADGDIVTQRGTGYGAAFCQILDSSGNFINSFGGSGGTSHTDDAAFSIGSASSITPVGYVALESGTTSDSVGDGDVGVARMTLNRKAYAVISDPTSDIHADVRDLTNSDALNVAIVDGTGDQITSFGGGVQYTEGATDASITGTAMMMEGAADILVPAQGTVADGLLVNLGANNDITGTVTANAGTNLNTSLLALESGGNLATLAGSVAGTEMQVDIVAALPAGTNNIGDVDVLTFPTTVHSADYDTGAGTDTTLAFGIAVPAAGGAVVVPGDATAGLKVDLGADNDVTITGTVTVSDDGAFVLAANSGVDIGDVTLNNGFATVTGGGVEAGSLRVTIASDSTGLLSIDDNGASITIDNTNVDNLHSSDFDTGAGTDTTPSIGIAVAASGGAAVITGDVANGLDVDVTRVSGTVTVTDDGAFSLAANSGVDIGDVTVNNAAGASAVNIQDGGNSITIDGNVGLLAGTNNIGDVDVLSVIPGTGPTNLGKAVDDAAGATDTGVAILAIRDDALTTLTPIDGDYVNLRVSSTGALHVTGGGGGTEYNEDDASPATIVGTATLMERDDILATVTPIEGDWLAFRGTAEGALWVQDFNSDAILADTTTIAGAVSGTEMQVDVVAALPAGTNNIGDVDVLTFPTTVHSEDFDTGAGTDTTLAFGIAVPASGGAVVVPGNATAGLKVDLGADNDVTVTGSVTASAGTNLNTSLLALEAGGNLATIAGAVAGTEMQVDVVAALPAGTNNIGDVDILSVIPGTGPTNLGKAEDVGHATGDVGVMALAVQQTADVALAGTTLDYAPLQVDETGFLKVNIKAGSTAGTEYTEGATDPSITGTAILMEGAADTLLPVQGTVADGLLVNLGANNDVTVTGTVTANAGTNLNTSLLALESGGNLATVAGAVAGTEMQVDVVAALPAGTNNIGDVDVLTFPSTVHSADFDTGAGTDTTLTFGIAVPASGGAVVVPGSATAGLKVDLGADNDVTITGTVTVSDDGAFVLAANSGVDIGDVTINNAAGASAVNVQDGGNSLTVDNATLAVVGGGTEAAAMRVTIANDSTGVVSVDDGAGSLTVDNATLSVTGGGVEASALRVTIANDSTGVVSIDDNAGSLTVDQATASLFNAQIVGNIAHDAADSGNPAKMGARARSTDIAAVASDDRSDLITDLTGKLIVRPHAIPELSVSGVNSATGTADTAVIAAQGAGIRIYVTAISLANSHATTSTIVEIKDGATVIWRSVAPASGGSNIKFDPPLRLTANTALNMAALTATTTLYFSANGYTGG